MLRVTTVIALLINLLEFPLARTQYLFFTPAIICMCITLCTNKCFKLTLFPERIISQIFIRMVEHTFG